mgnify:FL=1
MYFYFLKCNRLDARKRGQVFAQELLQNRTWPTPAARFSGYSCAVGTVGEKPFLAAGGQASLEDDSEPVNIDTRFDLASITKLFTGVVAALLAADKQLDLSAPIGSWMDVSAELSNLTSVELLTHTSGLADVWQELPTREQTIKSLRSLVPDSDQRGSLLYSCSGYTLFSVGLEAKFGKRFDQIVSELLLEPIGLTQTGFLPRDNTSNIAVSCEPGEGLPAGVVHDPRARHMDGVSGNAGLFGTANDLFRFFAEVATGDLGVVSNQARRHLFTPIVSGDWDQAIGFRFNDHQRLGDNKNFFSHTGFTGTLAMVHPGSQRIAVMLTNRLVCGTTREQMSDSYLEFANCEELAV